MGPEVTAAHSLGDLEAKLANLSTKPALVIADYRLPSGVTGNDIVACVQAYFGSPLPAAILTGDTAPQRLQEAKSHGMRLLHKPIDVLHLRALILDLLQPAIETVKGMGGLPSDWGQAAMASSEAGSTAWNSWQKPEPSLPLKPAQRTWSRGSVRSQGNLPRAPPADRFRGPL